jgi:hypothetical protein
MNGMTFKKKNKKQTFKEKKMNISEIIKKNNHFFWMNPESMLSKNSINLFLSLASIK